MRAGTRPDSPHTGPASPDPGFLRPLPQPGGPVVIPGYVLQAPIPGGQEWETTASEHLNLLVISDQCPPERAAAIAIQYAPGASWLGALQEARTA